MKKMITLILALAMCLTCLSGCGAQKEKPADQNDSNISATPSNPITLTFGHGQAESHSFHKAALHFKELIEDRSGGTIKVDVQGNGALGDEKEMAESLQLGAIDMCVVAVATLTGFDSELDIFNMPYLFDNLNQVYKVLDGEIGQSAFAGLENQGLKVLGFFDLGFRNMTNNLRPIKAPSDCTGLRMRTLQSAVCVEGLNMFGIDAVSMSFGELFTALQTGAIDGQENPISVIDASQFYSVQKYLSLTEHIYPVLPVMISTSTFNNLTSEQQALVLECVADTVTFQREANAANYDSELEDLTQNGMSVNEVDKSAFKQVVEPLYEKYNAKWGEAIAEIQAMA